MKRSAMTVRELIRILEGCNLELPVCYFDSKRQEYAELENNSLISRVWDETCSRWIISLNENGSSLQFRLNHDTYHDELEE